VWQSADRVLTTYLDGGSSGGVYSPVHLGLYTYSRNNPLRYSDPDGQTFSDFLSGIGGGIIEANSIPITPNPHPAFDLGASNSENVGHFTLGYEVGTGIGLVQSALEAVVGSGGEVGGVVLDSTGVGAIAGVPVNVASAGVLVHSGIVGVRAAGNLSYALSKGKGTEGVYEFPEKGKTYVGQSGNIENRLKQHGKSGKLGEGVTPNTREVQGGKAAREVEEQTRINELGGTKGGNVTNERNPVGENRKDILPEGTAREHLQNE